MRKETGSEIGACQKKKKKRRGLPAPKRNSSSLSIYWMDLFLSTASGNSMCLLSPELRCTMRLSY